MQASDGGHEPRAQYDIVMLVLNDVVYDRRVLAEAGALARAGWRVLVIGTQRADGILPDREAVNGFDLLRIRYGRYGAQLWRPWRWFRHGLQAWRIMWKLWAIKGRAWHAHDLHALMVMAVARWMKQLPVKLVYDAHELMLFMRPAGRHGRTLWERATLPVGMAIEGALARRADAVLGLCETRTRLLAQWYRIPRPVVVRNVPEPVVANLTPPTNLREVIGAQKDSKRRCIVHTGDVTNQGRCLTELVTALALVDEQNHLVFLGQGEAREALVEQACALGIENRVHFVPPVPPDHVSAVIQTADVAAILLRHESENIRMAVPNKLWEALEAGVPVVASNSFALRRIVDRYELGVTCDPADPKQVAAALELVLSDQAQSRFRARAKDAQAVYTWADEQAKLVKMYNKLLGGA